MSEKIASITSRSYAPCVNCGSVRGSTALTYRRPTASSGGRTSNFGAARCRSDEPKADQTAARGTPLSIVRSPVRRYPADIEVHNAIGDFALFHSNVRIDQRSQTGNCLWAFPFVALTDESTQQYHMRCRWGECRGDQHHVCGDAGSDDPPTPCVKMRNFPIREPLFTKTMTTALRPRPAACFARES